MYSWIKVIILLVILSLLVKRGYAQTVPETVDTVKTVAQADTVIKSADLININNDIELMEINIEAVIEMPSVAILPKRIEPELGEVKFVERSFEKELKQAPEKLMIIDNRLFSPKKAEDFKKKIINSQKSSKEYESK